MAGVDRVVPISRPYKLASSELAHHEPTRARHRRAHGRRRRHVLPDRRAVHGRVARADARGRARGRRPPAPRCCAAARSSRAPRRSRSRASGGQALEILAEARAETGLPVVTELLDAQHADAIAEHADVVQIGARNMQNYALLEVAGKLGKPVLLKRGLSLVARRAAAWPPTTSSRRATRRVDAVRARHPHLRDRDALHARPRRGAVAEAAHAPAGDRRPAATRRATARLVEPLSRAAAAVGADGIIVEVHQDPEAALCDGPQALYAARLRRLRARRRRARGAAGQDAWPDEASLQGRRQRAAPRRRGDLGDREAPRRRRATRRCRSRGRPCRAPLAPRPASTASRRSTWRRWSCWRASVAVIGADCRRGARFRP